MVSRIVLAVAAASAVLITATSGSAGPDDVSSLVFNVDPQHSVFAGAVATGVTRLPERLEIVLVGGQQPNDAVYREVRASLLALARGTLPHAAVEPLPGPAASAGPQRMIRESPPPGVRIRIPMPVTNEAVRDTVSRILAAINSRRYGDDSIGARIISIDHVFAGCTPFDAPTRSAAQTMVAELARVLGTPSATGLTLQPLPAARPFEAPAAGLIHCTGGFGIYPDASLPSSASYTVAQAFAFAQPVRFAIHASPRRAHEIRALWTGQTMGPHLNLRARGVLLTVEGSAVLAPRSAGTIFTYRGPNGRWSMSDITLDSLQAIRQRLRAAGVADDAIETQLNPDDGRWYVRVCSPGVQRNDAIVTAISGTVESERDAIETTASGDDCADEQDALVRAVADAQGRAVRIATGLGASIDLQPVAVRTGAGSGSMSCATRGTQYAPPTPLSKHISGQLQPRQLDNVSVTAFAIFRIGHPQFSGVVRSQVTSDDPRSITARFGYIPPPIDYPDAMHEGDAQLETRLRPQRIRVDMTLSPDNRHTFHAIDPGLAADLATTLGAPAAQYTAAFIPDANRGSMPTPGQMIFEAEYPNRGSATQAAVNAAQTVALSAGYGGFSIVPESDECAAVDDALALDAIRAAARNTTASERRGRVIAIDLRGPFTVDGLCGPTNSGVATWAIRNPTIKDVRLAAYARVSYGR